MEYHIELPDKDYDLILKEYKEIPLSQGKVALVDVEDYEWLKSKKWFYHKNRLDRTAYAICNGEKLNGKKKSKKMHRLILNASSKREVDHINHDGLDNRKSNLRLCSHSQNHCNSKIRCDNTSGYKGVSWHKPAKKWRTRIFLKGKEKYLGLFDTKENAALAYNKAIKEYYKEFANPNLII